MQEREGTGVLSGLRIARHDLVVVADDDVRYDDDGLTRIEGILADADLVRPQNHFDPLPWHARWDTARMLLNRSVAADHPGRWASAARSSCRSAATTATCCSRTSNWSGPSRPREAASSRRPTSSSGAVPRRLLGSSSSALDRPTTTGRSRSGSRRSWPPRPPRSRRSGAGDRPCSAWRRHRRSCWRASVGCGTAAGGSSTPVSPWLAPLWICERAVLSWFALARRLVSGGCPYAGTVIARAATPRILRRRLETRSAG